MENYAILLMFFLLNWILLCYFVNVFFIKLNIHFFVNIIWNLLRKKEKENYAKKFILNLKCSASFIEKKMSSWKNTWKYFKIFHGLFWKDGIPEDLCL